MNHNKNKVRALALAMALAAAMLPASSYAQEHGEKGGGLFGRGNFFDTDEWFRGVLDPTEQNLEGDISNYGIGEDVPLGSGIVLLIGAGLGYAVLKKKEDEQ